MSVANTNTPIEDGEAVDGAFLNVINPTGYYFDTKLTLSINRFFPHSSFMWFLQISGNTRQAMNVQT